MKKLSVFSILSGVLAFTFAASAADVTEFVLGAGGDVSLSQTQSNEVNKSGASKYDTFYSWADMTKGLKPLTAGNELNFMNLESVVSTSKSGFETDQTYPQWSHENGVVELLKNTGFNLVSVSNNHMCDYGRKGINSTYESLKNLQRSLGFEFSGLGYDNEVAKPRVFEVGGVRVAFAAIGMLGDGRDGRCRPSNESPGMLTIRACGDGSYETGGVKCQGGYSDYTRVLQGLRDADADLRILSIHEGTERSANPDGSLAVIGKQENRRVISKYNMADSYGIDVIIGHHTHNGRPFRMRQGRLDMFGLGNFLFLGGQNLNDKELWYSFGLFTRSYFSVVGGKPMLSAFEVIPLKDVHASPKPYGPAKSEQIIDFLNERNRANFPEEGFTFELSVQNTGVYCVPGVPRGDRARVLCGR
jgi:poly-gamma-glutamate synthesis protein (capsule biosynthesis protein)